MLWKTFQALKILQWWKSCLKPITGNSTWLISYCFFLNYGVPPNNIKKRRQRSNTVLIGWYSSDTNDKTGIIEKGNCFSLLSITKSSIEFISPKKISRYVTSFCLHLFALWLFLYLTRQKKTFSAVHNFFLYFKFILNDNH